jgi:hypothetical protein|tara:strand:+ start:259 stop:594 length:336 start_codon:yes stop_codon:yes gene_type:complete
MYFEINVFMQFTGSIVPPLDKYYQDFGNKSKGQHAFMSEYIDAMAHSLSIYHNNVLPFQYYQDMAWSGDLINTTLASGLSSDDKTRIDLAQKAEGDANTSATADSKSSKCR